MNTNEKNGFNVVVPYHGQYSAVRQCIGSIFLQTRKVPFRITLVDDGSPNKEFFSTIAQMDNQVDGVRFEQPKGFGACLNEAIKLTKEPWLVFMNSDCIVHESDWLIELHKALENGMKNKIGLVSSVMNNGGSSKLIERARMDKREKALIEVSEPLPLICAMAPRKLFNKVGLFKEYPFGWYEDEYFFWAMNKLGYKQAICEKSWVEHKGGLTTQMLWAENPEIKTIMTEKNREKCSEDVNKLFNK